MIKSTIQVLKQQPRKLLITALFTLFLMALDFSNRIYLATPSLPLAEYSINTANNTRVDISQLKHIQAWLESTILRDNPDSASEQTATTESVIETPLLTQGTNIGDKRVRLRAVFQQQRPKAHAFVLIEQQDINTRQISYSFHSLGDELAGYKLQTITSNSLQLVNIQQEASSIELLVFKN